MFIVTHDHVGRLSPYKIYCLREHVGRLAPFFWIINHKMSNNNLIIGIDVGGVLSIHSKNRTDITAEHENPACNMPGALNAIKALSATHELAIISFCGKRVATETHEAFEPLAEHFVQGQFYVKERKFKSAICKKLGCHVMIDDNAENLDSVLAAVPGIITILFGADADAESTVHYVAKTWAECLDIIAQAPANMRIYPHEMDVKKMTYNF